MRDFSSSHAGVVYGREETGAGRRIRSVCKVTDCRVADFSEISLLSFRSPFFIASGERVAALAITKLSVRFLGSIRRLPSVSRDC